MKQKHRRESIAILPTGLDPQPGCMQRAKAEKKALQFTGFRSGGD